MEVVAAVAVVAVLALLELLRDRRNEHTLRLLGETVAEVARSVGEAVKAATTPPPAPVTRELRIDVGVDGDEAAALWSELADPTDEVAWLREMTTTTQPTVAMGPAEANPLRGGDA